MAVLSFNFTKINVERKNKISKELKINTKMGLKDVKSTSVTAGSKQKAFVISFNYGVEYEPKVGSMDLEGELVYLADEKLSKEIEDSWKDKKALPKEIMLTVLNRILHNCNVESLILSKEIALPPPIQLPKVKIETPAPAKK
ncbi:MAG: hypothetical protein PHU51_03700 [Candidatus Nanoarchaeia archaeon]|nr:hypothetical protein [Candidatus Nanoarchaeia archaeon]